MDDQAELLDAYATLLELEGFVVRRFDHPLDVLDAIAAADTLPSLLVTDLQMPSMSGVELARAIKAKLESPPRIVCLTGSVQRLEEIRPEFDEVLTKPCHLRDLVSAIRRWT